MDEGGTVPDAALTCADNAMLSFRARLLDTAAVGNRGWVKWSSQMVVLGTSGRPSGFGYDA